MAARTVSNTGGNWNATTTWVGGVVPVAGDTVDFTATSGPLTVNVATANLVGIDFTNYVNTITFTNTINVNTTVNLGTGGYTQAGASGLTINGNTTITSNGVIWSRSILINTGTIVLTLNDDFNISGTFWAVGTGTLTLSFSGTGQFLPTGLFQVNYTSALSVLTITITLPNDINVSSFSMLDNSGNANKRNVVLNGNRNIFISGNVYLGNTRAATISGTCTLVPNGSGNFTLGTLGGGFSGIYSIPVNFSGNYTLVGNPIFTSTTITYTSGTITGASTIFTACTLNLNSGGKWGTDVTIRGNTTLTSNATFGNLTTNTTAVVLSGAFNINVEGNLAINIATSGASTPIVLNGTVAQSWTHGSAVYLSNSLTINKASGTLTLGANVYYQTGTLTYTQGDVDVTTNSSTIIFGNTSTFNNNNLVVNNLQLLTNSAVLTLNSDLTCIGRVTLGQGGKTITGVSNIYCDSFRFANNINASYIYNFNNCLIYTNDLLLEGAITGSAFNLNNGTFYVNRDLYVTGGSGNTGHYYGNSNIIMTGTGVLSSTSGLTAPLTINTSGKITVSSFLYLGAQGPSGAGGGTFTYIKGDVDARKSTLSPARAFTHTLTNMNKIVWGNVLLNTSLAITLNMNEFFCGDATTQTNITASTTTNAIVTFTDNFEKIAKFVTINGVTFTRPQQLLLLTNQPKKSRNRGIRYNNQSPNGIAKGKPSVTNTLTPGLGSFLVSEPIYN